MKHYYTALIEYDRPEDMPRVHAGMEALGGKVIAVHFDDMFKELERVEVERQTRAYSQPIYTTGCPVCSIGSKPGVYGVVCARGDCPTRATCTGAV